MSAAAAVPRLTLGLPVYNGERFLGESLEALLAQTYTDFELIISDNGSTDRTGEIAREYEAKDPRVRYVRHPVNRGSTFNHNFVIEQARGELFKWVSHDDLYDPELLQRCMDAIDARPEIALAHAWTAFIDEKGEVTHKIDYPLTTDVGTPSSGSAACCTPMAATTSTGSSRCRCCARSSRSAATTGPIAPSSPSWPFRVRSTTSPSSSTSAETTRPDHPCGQPRHPGALQPAGPSARQPLAAPGGPPRRGVPARVRHRHRPGADQS